MLMRVCDWIANYVYDQGVKRIHGLTGGGAMGLNDGFIKHPELEYIAYHHEQGAGHAAIGESKFTGKPSVVNPTTGCGGTNCITSVLNAWQDSVPVNFYCLNLNVTEENVFKYQACLGESHGTVGLDNFMSDVGATHVKGEGRVPVLLIDDLNLASCDLIIYQ